MDTSLTPLLPWALSGGKKTRQCKTHQPLPTTLTPSPTTPDSPDPKQTSPLFFFFFSSLSLSLPCPHYRKARETYTAPAPGTVVRVSRNSLWGSWWQKPTGIPRLTGFWRTSPRGGSRGSCCELWKKCDEWCKGSTIQGCGGCRLRSHEARVREESAGVFPCERKKWERGVEFACVCVELWRRRERHRERRRGRRSEGTGDGRGEGGSPPRGSFFRLPRVGARARAGLARTASFAKAVKFHGCLVPLRVTSHTSQEPWPWLWEPKRKCPKAVPRHLQNHVVWSRTLKCNVKSYVTRPRPSAILLDFPSCGSSHMIK